MRAPRATSREVAWPGFRPVLDARRASCPGTRALDSRVASRRRSRPGEARPPGLCAPFFGSARKATFLRLFAGGVEANSARKKQRPDSVGAGSRAPVSRLVNPRETSPEQVMSSPKFRQKSEFFGNLAPPKFSVCTRGNWHCLRAELQFAPQEDVVCVRSVLARPPQLANAGISFAYMRGFS